MSRFEACHLRKGFLLSAVCFSFLILQSPAICASWEPIGPDGGTFLFSVTNPADANEVTAFTTSPSPSYVWRSKDAGTTWTKIGEIPSSYVSDVAAFNFSTLYAITGSRCYRSNDGGATWTESRLPSNSGYAYNVCVDPTDNNKVYAVGYQYIFSEQRDKMAFFKSIDGGRNWSPSSWFSFDFFGPTDMAIAPTSPNTLYVTSYKSIGYDLYPGLFKSTDAGNTWTDISNLVDNSGDDIFNAVAVDPTDANKVYVGGAYLYRTTRTPRGTDLMWTRSPTRLYIYTIGIDPVDPSKIYTGGYESIGISADYGQSWILRPNSVKSAVIHIQVASANPSTVYASSYAGFYKSPNSGATWASAHGGLRAASIPALAVSSSRILIQSNGYMMAQNRARGRDAGGDWRYVVTPESCGEVCDILINPDNPDTVLILEGYG